MKMVHAEILKKVRKAFVLMLLNMIFKNIKEKKILSSDSFTGQIKNKTNIVRTLSQNDNQNV